MLVLPGIHITPMLVKSLLNLFHLLDGSLLGIALHATVECGVNLQSFGIVGIDTIVTIILLTPVLHEVSNGFAEIVGSTVVGCLDAVVQFDFFLLEGFALIGSQMMVAQHIVEHHITTVEGILRIDAGIIIGGCLEQSYQHRTLVGSQVLGCGTEIRLCCRFDAKGVGTEVYRVGIHRQNLLLIKIILQLIGGNPFLALHDEHFETRDGTEQSCRILRANTEQVLGQLLGNR